MSRTIFEHLDRQVKIRPEAPACTYKAASGGAWQTMSWHAWRGEVRQAGRGLMALGVKSGDVVAILADNRPEWTAGFLAAMMVGAAGSGIYQTSAGEQVGYILSDCQAPIVLLDTAEQWEKIVSVRENLPDLRYVITLRGLSIESLRGAEDDLPWQTLSWDALLERGGEVLASKLDERSRAVRLEDLGSVIYTSGTTGRPKGAMLSHENLLKVAYIIRDTFGLNAQDTGLSYLPLSHIAEQMMTIHMATVVGVEIHYAESIDRLAENLREVRPTLLFAVPRVWERMYEGIRGKLDQAEGAKAKLARWAIEIGRKAAEVENRGDRPGMLLAAQARLGERFIGKKVRAAIGLDRIRLAASGAAPVSGDILAFFSGLGLRIYEVYGLSESTGPATWNVPGKVKYGTVGPALPGIDIRLGQDGEVEISGPNVFQGYLNDPESTAEILQDGWFKSGDLGSLDTDGFLTITGRKKDILITSGGKNIAPAGIEGALKKISLVQDVIVLGDRRKFISALVGLEAEAAASFAAEHGLDPASLHNSPELRAALADEVEKVNAGLSRVENIREFRVLSRNLSIEEGELTPTLKVRRMRVEENWQHLVDDIYGER